MSIKVFKEKQNTAGLYIENYIMTSHLKIYFRRQLYSV